MSCSNWVSSSREMSPQRHNHYQLDGVALQLGLGLPVELIGVASNALDRVVNDSWRTCFIAQDMPPSKESKSKVNEIQQTVDGIPIRKVYITNLSLEVEREDIINTFGYYGRIMNIFLRVSKNDPCKKFAFVTFADPKAASRVLALHKFKDPKGRRMYVQAADSWHQPREGANGKLIWCDMKAKQEESEEEEDQSPSVESQLLQTANTNEEGLNILNDDCLLYIFSFLPLQEVARVERVCKRWQGLSYRVWRCLHKLSYSEPTMPNMTAQTSTLAAYLQRCGPSLRELDLSVHRHKFDETTLALVAKHCANLEVLRVARLEVGNRSLAHLGRSCPNLKQLVLDGCENFGDKDLMSLLFKCPRLTLLDISDNSSITGRFLSNVQSPLTSLHLNNLNSLKVNLLLDGLKRLTDSLDTLQIHIWTNLISEEVTKMVSAVPNLTSLTLSQSLARSIRVDRVDDKSLALLGQLSKLTSLNLSQYCGVNDDVLTAIVDGCKCLSNINLSSCGGTNLRVCLSEDGLAKLGTLRKLTHLDISYLDAATDTAVKKLSSRNNKIQQLVCRGCPDITDEGCVQVVTLCNELELFDLSGCNDVSNETVSAAVTSVKMRTNNVPLKLIVGGTEVEVTEALKHDSEVPLLTVEMIDLSEDHLRPDFIDDMFFPPSDSDEDEDLDHLCCDCDFEYDDMYDPTLGLGDLLDSTTVYEDDDEAFEQWEDNSDDCNDGWS